MPTIAQVVTLKKFVIFLDAIITSSPSIPFHFVCVCVCCQKAVWRKLRGKIALIFFRENYTL